jgi:hypothetical protein
VVAHGRVVEAMSLNEPDLFVLAWVDLDRSVEIYITKGDAPRIGLWECGKKGDGMFWTYRIRNQGHSDGLVLYFAEQGWRVVDRWRPDLNEAEVRLWSTE